MDQFKLMISGTGLETRGCARQDVKPAGHNAVPAEPEVPRVKCAAVDRVDLVPVAAVVAPVPTPLGERVGAGVVRRRFQYSGSTG